MGNAFLYERAKVALLDKAKDVDGVIEVRAVFQLGNDGNECVTMSGRPYRIVAMKAVADPQEASEARPARLKEKAGVLQMQD